MSDPVFLRSLISNTVYAEQMNSAQIQGQNAARERALALQQERVKQEAEQVQETEETAELGVEEDGRRGDSYEPSGNEDEERRPEDEDAAPSPDSEEHSALTYDRTGHIDVTL